MLGYLGQVWTIAAKDLGLELRSRERAASMGVFAVLIAVVWSFALDPTVRPVSVAGAMIWTTVLFAGMLGLGRAFALEREQEALSGILLAPVERGAVFLGKFAANLLILLAVEALIFPVYGLFFGLGPGRAPGGVVLVMVAASVGFVALGTLFGAVVAHTRLGETLLPILLLPLLIPVVIYGVSATQRLLVGRPLSEVAGNLKMLAAFDLIYLVVCTLAFGSVVEE